MGAIRTPKPPVNGRGFGRLVSYDLRDAAHPMRAHLRLIPPVTHKAWSTKPAVDQGDHPSCGGFSGLTLLQCGPVINDVHAIPDGERIYERANGMDEWSPLPHDGTSARGVMKALQSFGFITGYAWAGHVHDVCDWLLSKGPVIVGSVWTNSMMTPVGDAIHGVPYIRVDRARVNDQDVEGHLWCAFGVHTTGKNPDGSVGYILMQNSWGTNWSHIGHAKITLDDLSVLLTAAGECVAPTEVKLKAAAAA